jgi:hypothetical protein
MFKRGTRAAMSSKEDIVPAPKARAFLLGFHIAQEHPDGNVIRYLLRNLKTAKALVIAKQK